MKYENIIVFAGILLISLSVAVVISAAQDEQITKMSALAGSPEGYYDTGEDTFYQTVPTIFKITVHGEPTYSYTTRAYIDIEFNMSQPNQINASIVKGVKDYALNTYGFTLPSNKIRYQPYTRTTKAYSISDNSYYIKNPCDNSSLIEVSEYDYYTMEEKTCYKNISNGD